MQIWYKPARLDTASYSSSSNIDEYIFSKYGLFSSIYLKNTPTIWANTPVRFFALWQKFRNYFSIFNTTFQDFINIHNTLRKLNFN